MGIVEIAALFVMAVLAITLHEVAHGFAAYRFGDDTAKAMGRLTLNPLRHVDPVGTVLVPLTLGVVSYGALGVAYTFGWAKPVPVRRDRLRVPRAHMPVVALAGPFSNLVQAFILATAAKLTLLAGGSLSGAWGNALELGIYINILLMALNLIPVLPLDGGRALQEYLPRWMAVRFARLERWGLLIILLLVLTGTLSGPLLQVTLYIVQGTFMTLGLDSRAFY